MNAIVRACAAVFVMKAGYTLCLGLFEPFVEAGLKQLLQRRIVCLEHATATNLADNSRAALSKPNLADETTSLAPRLPKHSAPSMQMYGFPTSELPDSARPIPRASQDEELGIHLAESPEFFRCSHSCSSRLRIWLAMMLAAVGTDSRMHQAIAPRQPGGMSRRARSSRCGTESAVGHLRATRCCPPE